MKHLRRYASAGAVCLGLAAASLSIAAQKPDTKESPESQRPKLSLKAQPMIAISPARVVLTAELFGRRQRLRGVLLPRGRLGVGRRHRVGEFDRLRAVRTRQV